MQSEHINPSLSGEVQIHLIKGDSRTKIFNKRNTILTNAKEILARCLGGANHSIDLIKVYKAGAVLSIPTSFQVLYPNPFEVKFIARFDEASFNDTIDELRLASTLGGDFSQITGLSHLKDNLNQLEISWKITINTI